MTRLTNKYKEVQKKVKKAQREILEKFLQNVETESKVLVPKDTGALKNSFFSVLEEEGDKTTLVMGYDKEGVLEYAVPMHELSDIRHTPPERDKFLELPVNQNLETLKKDFKITVKKELNSIKEERIKH